jgi:RHS repeat-associated protein
MLAGWYSAIPFRYRGYVYDQETGFYYLNSRYYDPSMHRFINADSTSYLGANGDLIGYNLYAYCSNNPIMNNDPLGLWTVSIGFNAKAYTFVGVSITYSIVLDDNWNIAVQKTEVDTLENKGAVFGVLGASADVSYSATKCDTVFDLESASLEISGETLGGIVDMEANEFVGITVSDPKASVNAGVSGTIVVSTTKTIFSHNISTFLESVKTKWNDFWRKK